jgi:hypothetical protein
MGGRKLHNEECVDLQANCSPNTAVTEIKPRSMSRRDMLHAWGR